MNYKEPQGYGEQGKKDYLAGWMPDEDPTDGHVVRSTDEQEVETRRIRLARYRPNTAKKLAAWLALILGGMMLVGIPSGAVEGTSGGLKILLAVLYFLVFAGPALYWIYANKRDTKSVRQWAATEADYREVWESFDPATKSVFARPAPSEELPLLPKRPWLWIWIAEFAVIATAGTLTPA
ncbi:hypothetical protein ACN4D0_08825 [Corynebacterium macclintockiae]|uniref:hypothetical protein n=1 Tax=Corynebacterium macclintockiae TaxID=2913501 RepID=UPI003EB7E593